MITAYFDGLCEPVNPGGVGAYAYVIYKDNLETAQGKAVVGEGPSISNNLAEYAGLCALLQYLLDQGLKNEVVKVYSDSTLVVNQMLGHWKIRRGLYSKKALEARQLLQEFKKLEIIWISRANNMVADALSREAYREYVQFRKRSKPR